MHNRNRALGNAQSVKFLDTFAGIEAVKADLLRLKHGRCLIPLSRRPL